MQIQQNITASSSTATSLINKIWNQQGALCTCNKDVTSTQFNALASHSIPSSCLGAQQPSTAQLLVNKLRAAQANSQKEAQRSWQTHRYRERNQAQITLYKEWQRGRNKWPRICENPHSRLPTTSGEQQFWWTMCENIGCHTSKSRGSNKITIFS